MSSIDLINEAINSESDFRAKAKEAKRKIQDVLRIVYEYRLGHIHTSHLYVDNFHVSGDEIVVRYEWGNAGDSDELSFPASYLDMEEDDLIALLKSLGIPEAQYFRERREFLEKTRVEFGKVRQLVSTLKPDDGSERSSEYIEALENFYKLHKALNG